MPRTNLPGLAKPKWSLYDIGDNPEHDLARSLIMEFTDISGIEIDYYRRATPITNYDQIYGEANSVGYSASKRTKVLYDVGEEPNLWSNFGMVGGDIIVTHIPQGTFFRDVDNAGIPNIGDAVYIRWLNRLFEVAHVDEDDKIFQLKKVIWLMILKPFRYSVQSTSVDDMTMTDIPPSGTYGDNETINTESPTIDNYSGIDKAIYGF
jgi:hypothetical protein